MSEKVIEKCKLLVKNRDVVRTPFSWSGDSMVIAGSSFYVGMNHEANLEEIKKCEEILKKDTGIFSEYRGNVKVPLLCKMAVSADPEKYFEDVRSIVNYMKKIKWIDVEYKILAAMTIYDHSEPSAYESAVDRMAEIYQGMKENHPWLTSSEDIPFAAMLAVSGMNTDEMLAEMEKCYKELKKHFFDSDAVQSLSHVLAVDKTETTEKCMKVQKLWDMLKEKKHKYGTGFELSVLGTLTMLELSAEEVTDEIIAADDYLKTQKGFGDFIMGGKTRRMYAALMVMDAYVPEASRSHESLLSTMLASVIAAEVSTLMVTTTMCAVTVNSNN